MLKTYSICLAAVLCLGASQSARAQTRYNAQPRGNSVRVDGTSTTHDWEMEGTVIGGYFELGPGASLDSKMADITGAHDGKIDAKGHVHILIRTVHSKADHLPQVMDDLMQKTMKADQFPNVTFNLEDLSTAGTHAAGKPFDFSATGDLIIAGVTNKATIPLTISNLDATHLLISGSVPIKMTSYGITPPAPDIGLGMMKCGDGVKVSFDWTVRQAGK